MRCPVEPSVVQDAREAVQILNENGHFNAATSVEILADRAEALMTLDELQVRASKLAKLFAVLGD